MVYKIESFCFSSVDGEQFYKGLKLDSYSLLLSPWELLCDLHRVTYHWYLSRSL